MGGAPYTRCSNYLERVDTWVSLYSGPLLLKGEGGGIWRSVSQLSLCCTASLDIGMAEPSIVC